MRHYQSSHTPTLWPLRPLRHQHRYHHVDYNSVARHQAGANYTTTTKRTRVGKILRKETMTQQITITWSSDDNCYIARHNQHRYLSGHGDTPLKAHGELTIAIRASDEIKAMNNAKHIVTCLHIVKLATNEQSYVVGYLISEDDEKVVIANSIEKSTNDAFTLLWINKSTIIQRYDIPVTWW